jgi:hypothetical protein
MADDVLLSFRMQGEVGTPKVVPIWLGSAVTLADCLSYAQAFVPVLEDVSDAYVVSAAVQFALNISGQSSGATSGPTRTNDGARFSFDTAARYNWGLWIPAFKPALLADQDVDFTDLAVTALEAAIRVGLGGITPTDGNGNDVLGTSKGKFAYRK